MVLDIFRLVLGNLRTISPRSFLATCVYVGMYVCVVDTSHYIQLSVKSYFKAPTTVGGLSVTCFDPCVSNYSFPFAPSPTKKCGWSTKYEFPSQYSFDCFIRFVPLKMSHNNHGNQVLAVS